MRDSESSGLSRRRFLHAGAVGGAAVAAGLPGPALPANISSRTGRRALILSGGANRGVYEAGAVAAFVDQQGLRDGEPLPYDLVCGTSIGALNGYFIATAQYTRLRRLWNLVSTLPLFAPKSPYNKLVNDASGVGTRLYAALNLAIGLLKRIKGIVNPAGVRDLLHEEFHVTDPVHIPLYISTTNITRQRNEMFVRRGTTPAGLERQALNDELLADFQRDPIREIDDDIFYRVLFATAALPLVFDPIQIPHPKNGERHDEYVDGGVTKNIPADIALHCADQLHTMLVDPIEQHIDVRYGNATEIGLGVFSTMQRRIIELSLYLAYAESKAPGTPLPFQAFVMNPAEELPGEFGDFGDARALDRGWQIGYEDGLRGWQPYVPKLRGLVTND